MAKANSSTAVVEQKQKSASDQIRQYLRTHRTKLERKPKTIVEALKAEGIEVSVGLVNQIKSRLNKDTPKKIGKKTRKNTTNSSSSVEDVLACLEMANSLLSPIPRNKKQSNVQGLLASLEVAKNLLSATNGDLSAATAVLEAVANLQS